MVSALDFQAENPGQVEKIFRPLVHLAHFLSALVRV